MSEPKLAIIGAGYVGLVAGCCFAHLGYPVVVVENAADKLKQLQDGQCPIYEPGLSELLQDGLGSERLRFAPSIAGLLGDNKVDIICLAVGTPSLADGRTDTTFLFAAVNEILDHLRSPVTIVIKSTVPVGTAAKIKTLIVEKNISYPVAVVNNPEFLREGRAVHDFLRPDRVVIGASDASARETVAELYRTLERQGHRIILTTNEEAELAKYACNFMLASRITAVNQIAALCGQLGIDVHKIREIMGSDSRIGGEYLYAGMGYGGSCLPKDVQSFICQCRENRSRSSFAEAVHEFNEGQKCCLLPVIKEHFQDPQNVSLGVLGLAFKAETDDVRESVALSLVPTLLKEGYSVKAHDPKAVPNFSKSMTGSFAGKIEYCGTAAAALNSVDAVVVLTEWQEYRKLTPEFFARHVRGKVIFDGRNLLDRQQFAKEGFVIKGVGWGE